MKTQKTQFIVLPVKLWFVQCVAERKRTRCQIWVLIFNRRRWIDTWCQKLNCLPNSMSRLGWRIGSGEFIEGFAGPKRVCVGEKNVGNFMVIDSIGSHVGGKFAHLSGAPGSRAGEDI